MELYTNAKFEYAALELGVDSKFLLSGTLFLHIYINNDTFLPPDL